MSEMHREAERRLTSAQVGELDRLLGEWGARARLTAAEVEEVRLAIVAAPSPGLDAAWWHDLVGQVSTQVIKATALPASSRAALRPRWRLA